MPASDRASTRRRPATAAERLGRLLVIVPYAVEHPGTRIDELASLFGVEEDALVEDLGVLFMSGLPPYSPGDLVDVDIEDGRVWIGMAEFFSRPLRLTRSEALALVLRGTALAGMPGVPDAQALTTALAKLRDGLGPDVLGPASERVEAAAGERPADSLGELRAAANRSERVEIDYLSASGDASSRRIDPEEVFAALGHWYVAAWDTRSDEERLFRVDRIKRLARSAERFEPRGLRGAGRPLYTPTERDIEIRLLLRADARWVAEYHPVTSTVDRGDGSTEVTMPARGLTWAAKLVLRVAPQAKVLGPPELEDSVRTLARATRERYV